jgi:hypothetical protein
MQSRSGVIVTIFLITVIYMSILAFLIPGFSGQGRTFLIVATIVAGVILAGTLSAVVFSLVKAPAEKAREIKEREVKAEVKPPLFEEKVVQILSILQRKGRLIDFLREDISGYEDSQIGAAVRNIHKGCREAMAEHIVLEPVRKEAEGTEVSVGEGFDPSAIRLTGNVIGSPPFRGVLRHGGWRAVKTEMPRIPKSQDRSIIEPAEIELS